jgi:SAM-dependent methyltransferase/acyl carrier protein
MAGLLVEERILRREAQQWEVLQPISPGDDALVSTAEMLARLPEYRTEIEIFDRCASQLGEVLQGQCDPLQLLFPAGSTKSATQLYQDASMSRLPNALIRVVGERLLDAVPKGGVFRILEIGAGTGGTTAHLLPLMRGRACEYVFSDVSPLFLHNALERFADYPFLRFALLDIELSPLGQGFAPGQFDLIVAANAIHATRDLRQSLAHVRSLLIPGGMMVLLEGFRPSRWVDLVFGQTEGWWRFADTDLRPSHPLVGLDTWRRILGESGFIDSTGIPAKLGEEPGLFDQAVILATVSQAATAQPPGTGLSSVARRSPWLLISENASVGQSLKDMLAIQEQQVELVDAGHLQQDLAGAISDPAHAFDHVLFLARQRDSSLTAENPDELFGSATALSARALHIAQALINDTRAKRPRLWLITHGAQPAGGSIPSDAAAAALWGFGRVLAVEHPEIWGGLIDLDSTTNSSATARLIAEQILHSDGEDQCAFHEGIRYVPRLVSQTSTDPATAINWKGEGSFIVTGGLGGVGLHLATWLAEQGARNLVLIGRTPLPPRTEWDRPGAGESVCAQIDAIRKIEHLGTVVRTIAVDITNSNQLSSALAELERDGWFPVRGVVHAAAAIDDLLIPRLGEKGIIAVMRPKVFGALTLEKCLAGQPLEFFACCSSLGSLLGQAGQANYAAANAVLDSLVYDCRARGVPMLSLNWGGWYGAGFAVTAGGKRAIRTLEQRGIMGFAPAEGAAAFGHLLHYQTTQAVVMRVDEKKFRHSYPAGEEPPLLRELVRGNRATRSEAASGSKPNTGSVTTIRKQLLALESGAARREKLQAHLASLLAAVLKMEPGVIDVEKPMGALGLDSLMGFELKNRCEQSLGLKLSATMTWNYPTIATLTGFLAGKLDVPLVDESTPVRSGLAGDSAVPIAAGTGVSIPVLEELSEEEALSALLKRKDTKE